MSLITLVTGSSGFIGNAIAEKLAYMGYSVVGLDIENIKHERIFETIYCDITDLERLTEIFNKFKVNTIFHCAALPRVNYSIKNPISTNNTNIGGTLNLLSLASKYEVKRFIFTSSSTIYGNQTIPFNELNNPQPESPYAIQKLTCENYCKYFSNFTHMSIIVLRYFTVYGPGQLGNKKDSTVIAKWFYNYYFKNSLTFEVYGDGRQKRDFTFIEDIVEASINVMKLKKGFNIFNIGSGKNYSLLELFEQFKDILGNNAAPSLIFKTQRKVDTYSTLANINKAVEILNYKVNWELKSGLELTNTWYKKQIG